MRERLAIVERNTQGQAIRIFKNRQAARSIEYLTMEYVKAVGEIRHQIFMRSCGNCELCGTMVTEKGGHMHEQKHRGKGGEISLENSVFICPTCHRRAHADRNTRFSSSKPPESRGFVTDNIKDGETVCRHGVRPFDCRICTGRAEKT
jgi:5-methylcytosine-specific restriction endonuclease McrA